jgi:5-methylcytosine-specific restriction endonuclease McrA
VSKVLVVDTEKRPLNPVHPGRARILLSSGQAAVYRRYPFTIVLKKAIEKPAVETFRVKIDPGSRNTGIAVVNDASAEVVFAAVLIHRGAAIRKALEQRRVVRRSRRQRHTRYRKPRFLNRRQRKEGWLPPSLESRIANVLTWVERLRRLCPIAAISMELVRFDLQLLEHPGISGMEYQQGTLQGYELREYLLEKWERRCAYCDASDVPLQVEHVQCRAKLGSSRASNLALACEPCNVKKGTQDIRAFLQDDPVRLAHILSQLKAPLRDAAAVNTTRWALYGRLRALGLPFETGSGGLTKYNRILRGFPKAHWLDAACVGNSTPKALKVEGVVPLLINATGHGSRQMCLMDRFGFPRTAAKQVKRFKGFQTGDIVRAIVTRGKKTGTYVGRVAIRATGYFNITMKQGTVQDISFLTCTHLHHCDGYSYQKGEAAFSPNPVHGTGLHAALE